MKPPSPAAASSNWPVSAAAQPPHAVAHDHDLVDLELGHREFERGRDAVTAAAGLERRGEVGDVADDEHLARVGVEDHAPDRPGCRSRR